MENAQQNYYSNYLTPAPSTPEIQPQPQPQSQPELPLPENSKKRYVLPIILIVLLTIVSLVSIIFSVAKFIEHKKLFETHKQLELKNQQSQAIISRLSETTGREIKTPNDVPEYNLNKELLYLKDWGLKIKFSSSIQKLGYVYNPIKNSFCFAAIKYGVNAVPNYFDLAKNPEGNGCIFYLSGEQKNIKINNSEVIFSDENGSLYYVAPSKIFSKEPADKHNESLATSELKQSLKTAKRF